MNWMMAASFVISGLAIGLSVATVVLARDTAKRATARFEDPAVTEEWERGKR